LISEGKPEPEKMRVVEQHKQEEIDLEAQAALKKAEDEAQKAEAARLEVVKREAEAA